MISLARRRINVFDVQRNLFRQRTKKIPGYSPTCFLRAVTAVIKRSIHEPQIASVPSERARARARKVRSNLNGN